MFIKAPLTIRHKNQTPLVGVLFLCFYGRIPPPSKQRSCVEFLALLKCCIFTAYYAIINNMKLSKQKFYCWAYSDLLINVNRGRFAEYLVATALGIDVAPRQEWDAYDLMFKNIKIEVKSSAYIQGWNQHGKLSKLNFSIRPTYAYDDTATAWQTDCIRQSDVYVFCVLNHTDINTVAPEDTNQWDFYVVATKHLNSVCGNQKTITLSALRHHFNVLPIKYENLKSEILNAVQNA